MFKQRNNTFLEKHKKEKDLESPGAANYGKANIWETNEK